MELIIRPGTQYYILCAVLFLFGLGLDFYVTLFFVFYVSGVVFYRKCIDYDVLLLICFLLSYLFIDVGFQFDGGIKFKMRFLLLSVGSYFIGRDVFFLRQDYQVKSIFAVLLYVLGLGIKGVAGFVYTMQYHPEAFLSRQYYDFFQRSEVPMHGLGLSSFFAVSMALIPILVYGFTRYGDLLSFMEKGVAVFVLLMGGIGAYASNILQNRTPFAVMIIALLVPFFSLRRNELSKYVGYALTLMLVMVVMYVFYLNPLNRHEPGVLSRSYGDVSSLNGRVDFWLMALEYMMYYPLGAKFLVEGRPFWFHNFWLDVFRVSGFVPLIAIVLFQFRHLGLRLRRFIREFLFEGNVVLVSLVALLLVMMTTPVLEGPVQVYYFSMIIFGYIKGAYLAEGLVGVKAAK